MTPNSASYALALSLLVLAPISAFADAKAGEKKAQLCLLCHKPNNVMAYVPTLEGQTREYLYNQIKAYKEKRRPDPVMQSNVASLSARDMRDIADYFASRKPVRGSFNLDTTKVSRGKSKAEALKCTTCHAADFSGKKEIPRLAGLEPRYTAPQLLAFAGGKRAHPPAEGLRELSADDADDLAQYFAQLD